MGKFKDGTHGVEAGLNGHGMLYDSDSNGSYGYLRFTNGFTLQWGSYNSSDSDTNVQFEKPFGQFFGMICYANDHNDGFTGSGQAQTNDSPIRLAFPSGHAKVNGTWQTAANSFSGPDFPCEGMKVRHTENNAYTTAIDEGGIGQVSWIAWGHNHDF